MKEKLKSIESKILFWIVILTLLPLIAVIIQGYHCSSQAIVETKKSQLLSILNWKTDALKGQLKKIENEMSLLSIVSFHKSDAENSIAACHQFGCTCNPLTHITETRGIYKSITAFDVKGNELEGSSGMSGKKLDAEILTKVSKLRSVLFFREENSSILKAAAPLVDKSTGKLNGFVVAEVNFYTFLESILKEIPFFGKTGRFEIVSENGEVYSLNSKGRLKMVKNRELLNLLKRQKENSVFEFVEKKKRFAAYRYVDKVGLYTLVSVDKRETLKWVGILVKRSVITGLISFLMALFAGIMISKKLSAPLKQLEQVSEKIINGDLNARVGEMDTKEAKAVADGFNAMMDKLVEQSRELSHKSALAAIGELSSSIVHEMRNPLSSIKLNINAFKSQLEGHEVYGELIEITKAQVERLENMLKELLNYGKPLELSKERIDPVQLVQDAVELVSVSVSELNQKILVVSKLPEGIKINGDKEHLLRALTNLIQNASDASGKNGNIKIVLSLKNESFMVISIEDEGGGISDAVKDMVFKPFFTTKERGTGLGLSIVKKIVEYHGGKVYAENSDKGAVFSIELPVIKDGGFNV